MVVIDATQERISQPQRLGLAPSGSSWWGLPWRFSSALLVAITSEGWNCGAAGESMRMKSLGSAQAAKIIQTLLGHSSIVQTMDTYSHLLDDVDEASARI
jgi:hypothetical protein